MATSVEDLIKSSICFGVAYDDKVKECSKICEVRLKCKSKCECGIGELPKKPEPTEVAATEEVTFKDDAPKPAKKSTKTVAKKEKKQVEYSDDMPDLKSLSQEEIEKLAVERGLNLSDFEKYSNDNIKRMRITMAIKKTYES